ncbi:MAG TPA: phytoene desaturase family protein [Blastocatellia bacterium]
MNREAIKERESSSDIVRAARAIKYQSPPSAHGPLAAGRRPVSVSIVGGGLGGLSAAIHLKLAGYDVTIFEANDRVGGRANLISRGGFRFDTGPSLLNYPWVFEELFRAAGRDMRDYVQLLPVDPSVSFQWPDGARLDLSSDLQKLLEEFERIEPGVRPRAIRFLRDAANKYRIAFDKLVTRNEDNFVKWLGSLSVRELTQTSVWRSLDGELGRFFRSRHIREALGSYGMYLGGSPYDLPGLFSILPYGELAFGLWLPRDGVYGLVSGIEKLARELGVRILTGLRARRIVTRCGRVTGVELEDGSLHNSPVVVSNVDVPTTNAQLLNGDDTSPGSRGRIKKTKMTPGVLTFYWGIRGEVENIRHHTIFLPSNYRAAFDDLLKLKRVPEDMPFYVSMPSATDRDLAPEGCATMFALVPTPLVSEMPGADWAVVTRKVKARIIERLQKHGVNLTPGRIIVEEVYTPVDWRRRFGLHDGSAFGAAHTLFQMGPLRARNYAERVEGLYYVGASTTPGTGMPMVVLGGRMVAERVAEFASRIAG